MASTAFRCMAGVTLLPSLGSLGMAGRGQGEPDDTPLVVDAVPEAPGAGDLVLPLLERVAVDQAAAKRSLEGMLPLAALSGIGGDPLPGGAGVAGRRRAHLLPTRDGIAGGVTEVPSCRLGGR